MPLTPPGNSNRAAAALLYGTTSNVLLTQNADTATVDLPNIRINGNTSNTAAAAGTGAIAIGGSSAAAGNQGIAVGPSAVASAQSALGVGHTAIASGTRSTAIGVSSTASATDAAVLGSQCTNALDASVLLAAGTGNKLLHLCAPGAVAQGTSNNTTVAFPTVPDERPVGVITMFDDVNAAAAQFTFTNGYINANSIILLDVEGEPSHPVNAWVATRGAGSCVIDVVKDAGSTPTVPAKIHYVVFNPT